MAGSAKRVSEIDAVDADMIAPPIKATQRVTKLRDLDGIESVDLAIDPPPGQQLAGALKGQNLDNLEADIDASMIPPPPGQMPKTAAAAPPTVQPSPSRAKDASFFSSSFATPAELDRALIDKYGVEWLEWEPETIWQTIRMDFDTQISRINQEKINAAKLLHLSDSFFRYWDTFEKVVLAFNNIMPLFDRIQDFTLGQAAHAMRQAAEIRKEPYQNEVLTYLATKARTEGLIWLPPPLDVMQEALDRLNPAEVVPLKAELRERWEAFENQDMRNVELREDLFGVHLAKLGAIEEYLKTVSSPEVPEAA